MCGSLQPLFLLYRMIKFSHIRQSNRKPHVSPFFLNTMIGVSSIIRIFGPKLKNIIYETQHPSAILMAVRLPVRLEPDPRV